MGKTRTRRNDFYARKENLECFFKKFCKSLWHLRPKFIDKIILFFKLKTFYLFPLKRKTLVLHTP
jgi:hypothetical protein